MAQQLMASVSGIRGIVGESLTPPVILRYISAYSQWLGGGTVAVGRDTRKSGPMIQRLVEGLLLAHGVDVVNLGICPTPTLLHYVRTQGLDGGVLITASHNPILWNALKLVKKGGAFLNQQDLERFNTFLAAGIDSHVAYQSVSGVGTLQDAPRSPLENQINNYVELFDIRFIKQRKFRVAVDPGNGAGAVMDRLFLKRLGCQVFAVNEEITGDFGREPEPRPDALFQLGRLVKENNCQVGFAQDPDADRLCLVDEKGTPLSEEITLALAVLSFFGRKQTGTVVANVSTSRLVRDIARHNLAEYRQAPVGEANVLQEMQQCGAPIGGEGNGGVILPRLNPCRDSFVAMLLVLDLLARQKKPVSAIVANLPGYVMIKEKIALSPGDTQGLVGRVTKIFHGAGMQFEENGIDGIRLDFPEGWIHVRKSNTEPVVRVIAEGSDGTVVQKWINMVRAALE